MEDKRSEQRHRRKADAYLELTVRELQGDYIQKVISCETVDLSERGIKIYMSEPISQGTITDILIELTEYDERYFLTAEVKWITSTADDGWYFAGFEIYNAENTDFLQWQEMIAQRINKGDSSPVGA